MVYLISIVILGINLAPFLFINLDIWHAQGIWLQSGIMFLFGSMFFLKKKHEEPRNVPLGLLNLWIGCQTAFICYCTQLKHKYDIEHFFPYFNFLCIIFLYKIIVTSLNSRDIDRIFEWARYSVIVTLLLAVLQSMGVSQFFQLISTHHTHNNLVTGFIGNGTHLSGFLGMLVPLSLYKINREKILTLILCGIILLFLTGTTKGDPAISGIIVALAAGGYYIFKKNIKAFWIMSAGVLFLGILYITFFKSPLFFSPQNRLDLWIYYWQLIQPRFLTGAGLGTMNIIYQNTLFKEARHLHLEYYQFLLELGAVSLLLIIYFVKDLFKKKDILCKAVFLGFLISGLFNYPMHLWLVSGYACLFYSALIIKERDDYACCD